MNTSGSVAGRAALAVGLMFGFYLLALAIASALVWVPVAEVIYTHRLHPKIALICLFGAGSILWSILPRWDRFEAPGPLLEPAGHPRLFAELEGVARATGQAMPSEVFLVGDVNAWVAQRGGVMGFFSRRVMGIGLPLLQTLSVSELRAVLAHEFGHFHGGDTRLGPWVYKTRSAIGRTLGGLGNSLISIPFRLYGNLFMGISQAVSRRQELGADALASRVAGSRPLVEGLKKLAPAAAGYEAYWSQEVLPVVQAGFLPPIAEGFQRFAADARVSTAQAKVLEQALRQEETNPYDTHPSLAERIAAASVLPEGPDPSDEPPAISLLSDVPDLERRWFATVFDAASVGKLVRVAWEQVVPSVFLPLWRDAVQKNAAVLEGSTVGDLPRFIAEGNARARLLPGPLAPDDSADSRKEFVRWLAATGTIVALERAGWTIKAPPGGAPVSARQNGDELLPFDALRKVADGSLTGDAWRDETSRLGVAGLPLAG
jgi:Zn-dependent protease with chaperone function